MEKINITPVKHREDVIDTLQLKANEKRVLIGLIVVLLFTIGYKNSSYITAFLLHENIEVAQLGVRRGPVLDNDALEQVVEAAKEAAADYPQFAHYIKDCLMPIHEAAAIIAEPEKAVVAKELFAAGAIRLMYFSQHPVITPTDNLEKLSTTLSRLMKAQKIDFASDYEIRPLNFTSVKRSKPLGVTRNLFEYSTRNKGE